ncbi:hypothetical protein ABW19_dt0207917 [Dactylella cylindrospora]|nr:hypothetical protein ABW19_dt0207917 [Dactylella cylindrospora]
MGRHQLPQITTTINTHSIGNFPSSSAYNIHLSSTSPQTQSEINTPTTSGSVETVLHSYPNSPIEYLPANNDRVGKPREVNLLRRKQRNHTVKSSRRQNTYTPSADEITVNERLYALNNSQEARPLQQVSRNFNTEKSPYMMSRFLNSGKSRKRRGSRGWRENLVAQRDYKPRSGLSLDNTKSLTREARSNPQTRDWRPDINFTHMGAQFECFNADMDMHMEFGAE